MKRVLAVALGSSGDVNPILGIARGLVRRGHEVIVLANDVFEDAVTGTGAAFESPRTGGSARRWGARPPVLEVALLHQEGLPEAPKASPSPPTSRTLGTALKAGVPQLIVPLVVELVEDEGGQDKAIATKGWRRSLRVLFIVSPPLPLSPDSGDQPLRTRRVGIVLGPEVSAQHPLLGTEPERHEQRHHDEVGGARQPVG